MKHISLCFLNAHIGFAAMKLISYESIKIKNTIQGRVMKNPSENDRDYLERKCHAFLVGMYPYMVFEQLAPKPL